METSASFEARSAPSSYPTASQSDFPKGLRTPARNCYVSAAFWARMLRLPDRHPGRSLLDR